jgi:tRNA 2-thiouridine synthesizing protein A
MNQDVRMLVADKRIDCTGLFCPMPIVKTREAIATMAVGEVLEMTSDDPGSDPDMRSWAQITGHELLTVSREGGLFRFLVRKSR